MTRNHASYIYQAAESILSQLTNFSFELLIGEDHSDDNTLIACRELQAANPATIRLITATEQVGITANFLRLHIRARGKLIALLEGDDYWTVDCKLQRQVDLLESNDNWAWCGARTLNRIHPLPARESYELKDACRRFLVHTSTILYRHDALHNYPKFPDIVGWISMVCIVLSQAGSCGFLDEKMSYYRRHSGGLYTGAGTKRRIELAQAFTDVMREYLTHLYDRELFDRELWICSWELQLNPNTFSLQGWLTKIWLLLWLEAPRLSMKMPVSFLVLTATILIQPIRFGYFRMRSK